MLAFTLGLQLHLIWSDNSQFFVILMFDNLSQSCELSVFTNVYNISNYFPYHDQNVKFCKVTIVCV